MELKARKINLQETFQMTLINSLDSSENADEIENKLRKRTQFNENVKSRTLIIIKNIILLDI